MYHLIRSSGHDQDFDMRAELENILGHRTSLVRHQTVIDDEQINLLIAKRLAEFEGLRGSGRVQDGIPLFCKRCPDHIAHNRFVVDNQNRRNSRTLDVESGWWKIDR